jgi:hypothetical protein
MSFDLMLPPILGAVGLVIAFAIYTLMSRAPAGRGKGPRYRRANSYRCNGLYASRI